MVPYPMETFDSSTQHIVGPLAQLQQCYEYLQSQTEYILREPVTLILGSTTCFLYKYPFVLALHSWYQFVPSKCPLSHLMPTLVY